MSSDGPELVSVLGKDLPGLPGHQRQPLGVRNSRKRWAERWGDDREGSPVREVGIVADPI